MVITIRRACIERVDPCFCACRWTTGTSSRGVRHSSWLRIAWDREASCLGRTTRRIASRQMQCDACLFAGTPIGRVAVTRETQAWNSLREIFWLASLIGSLSVAGVCWLWHSLSLPGTS